MYKKHYKIIPRGEQAMLKSLRHLNPFKSIPLQKILLN